MQKTIAKGKEDVLAYLEQDALKRTGGKPGIYRLFGDDSGNLLAIIAGRMFSGTFTLSASDAPMLHSMKVEKGMVIEVED
jgi:hypothetical protein